MKTINIMRDGRPATQEELQAAVEGRPLPPVRSDALLAAAEFHEKWAEDMAARAERETHRFDGKPDDFWADAAKHMEWANAMRRAANDQADPQKRSEA